MCLLYGNDVQDLDYFFVFINFVKGGIRSGNMQPIDVFMSPARKYLSVALTWKKIISKRFAFFYHNPLAFLGQFIDEF
jgi:hypothetical protein